MLNAQIVLLCSLNGTYAGMALCEGPAVCLHVLWASVITK